MHRDVVSHLCLAHKYLLTASVDGQLKLWARDSSSAAGLSFVKAFSLHAVPLALAASPDAQLAVALSSDNSLKKFAVTAFDLADFVVLPFRPARALCFVRAGTAKSSYVLIADAEEPAVHVFAADDLAKPPKKIKTAHVAPLVSLAWNDAYKAVVSADAKGIVEYWTLDVDEAKASSNVPGVQFQMKWKTDLFEFAKKSIVPTSLRFSKDGKQFVCMAPDRRVRVFHFETGKLRRVYDESLQAVTVSPAAKVIPAQELGRRMARERQVDADVKGGLSRCNAVFDASGEFLLYATVAGIHVVDLALNRVSRVLGQRESAERYLAVELFDEAYAPRKQGIEEKPQPLLVASSFDSQRLYLYGSQEGEVGRDRDVFNERPMVRHGRRGSAVATSLAVEKRKSLPKRATLHTSQGDIVFSLLPSSAPRTVENFCTHAKNGYFNGVIFHRVIKGFMIQTGDPDGDGTGGESVWGGEFEDEIDQKLTHDVGTLSMANAGPNTNGSQFFVTCQGTPHLDGKHTIFGKVINGMGVVRQIENAKTDKRDRPLSAIRIESVSVHAE